MLMNLDCRFVVVCLASEANIRKNSPYIPESGYPRETPPHISGQATRTGTADSPQRRHTAAGTGAPTTADKGNTVPQRANPTQTAYLAPEGGPSPGSALRHVDAAGPCFVCLVN